MDPFGTIAAHLCFLTPWIPLTCLPLPPEGRKNFFFWSLGLISPLFLVLQPAEWGVGLREFSLMRLDLNWMKFRPFGPKSDVWGPLAFFLFGVFCLSSLFLCVVVAMSGYVWVISGYLVVQRSLFLSCLLYFLFSGGIFLMVCLLFLLLSLSFSLPVLLCFLRINFVTHWSSVSAWRNWSWKNKEP